MLYHERECKNKENANFVYIVYLLTKLCNIFGEAFFIDISIITMSPFYIQKVAKSAAKTFENRLMNKDFMTENDF